MTAPLQKERLQLTGKDRTRYFAPVAFAGYICAVCIALIATSPFLPNKHQAVAVAAAGVFGLALSSILAAMVWTIQRRELRYWSVVTRATAAANYQRVAQLAQTLGWNVTGAEPARSLQARTADSLLQQGEIVAVQFRETSVRVASICDPEVGYSLVGRRRCQEHRTRVLQAVLESRPEPSGQLQARRAKA